MTDRTVSLGCLAAWAMWCVVAVVLAVAFLLDDQALGQCGLGGSAAAATATIRCYFVRQNRLVRAAVESAQRDGSRVHALR